MKTKLIVLACFVIVFILSGLLIKNDSKKITSQELSNLSMVIDKVFASRATPQMQTQPVNNSSVSESMMVIIYKKKNATWFIKSRGLTSQIDKNAAKFSQLFLEQLTFDANNQPDFSHIPADYKSAEAQAMRFAVFNLNGLEVSVTMLSANQDISANIARWRQQLSLPASNPGFVKYQDNNNTVLVRLNQPTQSNNNQTTAAAALPEKEPLNDFLTFEHSDKWKILDDTSGMASGKLQLNDHGVLYEVAVLRLPITVPLETVLSIWKTKANLPAGTQLTTSQLSNQYQQKWQLIPMVSEQFELLIAAHKGATKHTFLRLSGGKRLPKTAKEEFKKLLKNSQIIKP